MKKLLALLLCLILMPAALAEETTVMEEIAAAMQAKSGESDQCVVEEKLYDNTRYVKYWNSELERYVWWECYVEGCLTTQGCDLADGSIYVAYYDEAGELLYFEICGGRNEQGYQVDKRFLPDGTQDHEWWWSGAHELYHEIWMEGGSVVSYTYWYYNTEEAATVYEEYRGDGVLRKRFLYDENGECFAKYVNVEACE